jgi:hypothetical protein
MQDDWDACPVCFLDMQECAPIDGPTNSDIATKCMHYLCVSCWQTLYITRNARCPLCREDVSEWLYTHYETEDEDEDGDGDDDEDES